MEKRLASKDWLSLDGINRAQIILVAKKLKSGTIVSGNSVTKRLIKKLGLYFIEKTINGHKIFTISKNKSILTKFKKNKNKNPKVIGKFLSYPPCCVKEYSRKRTKKEIESYKKGNKKLSYKLGRQISLLIRKKKNYPEYLNFCPPTFTPCDIHCKNAKKILLNWKESLIKEDPTAAKKLEEFNINSNKKSN